MGKKNQITATLDSVECGPGYWKEGNIVKLSFPCNQLARVHLSLYLGLQIQRFICYPQGSSLASSSIFFPLPGEPLRTLKHSQAQTWTQATGKSSAPTIGKQWFTAARRKLQWRLQHQLFKTKHQFASDAAAACGQTSWLCPAKALQRKESFLKIKR